MSRIPLGMSHEAVGMSHGPLVVSQNAVRMFHGPSVVSHVCLLGLCDALVALHQTLQTQHQLSRRLQESAGAPELQRRPHPHDQLARHALSRGALDPGPDRAGRDETAVPPTRARVARRPARRFKAVGITLEEFTEDTAPPLPSGRSLPWREVLYAA